MAEKEQRPIVLVEWTDAFSRDRWMTDTEVEADLKDPSYMVTWTVGYLLSEGDPTVVAASRAYDAKDSEWKQSDIWFIPAGMVRDVTELSAVPVANEQAERLLQRIKELKQELAARTNMEEAAKAQSPE